MIMALLRFLIAVKVYTFLVWSAVAPECVFGSERERIKWTIRACYGDGFVLEKWAYFYGLFHCKKRVLYRGKPLIARHYVCGLVSS